MCYDMSPRQEILKDKQNSVLLSCNLELGYLHAPTVLTDGSLEAEKLDNKLANTVVDRELILKASMIQREEFVEFWADFLNSRGHSLGDKM